MSRLTSGEIRASIGLAHIALHFDDLSRSIPVFVREELAPSADHAEEFAHRMGQADGAEVAYESTVEIIEGHIAAGWF